VSIASNMDTTSAMGSRPSNAKELGQQRGISARENQRIEVTFAN